MPAEVPAESTYHSSLSDTDQSAVASSDGSEIHSTMKSVGGNFLRGVTNLNTNHNFADAIEEDWEDTRECSGRYDGCTWDTDCCESNLLFITYVIKVWYFLTFLSIFDTFHPFQASPISAN